MSSKKKESTDTSETLDYSYDATTLTKEALKEYALRHVSSVQKVTFVSTDDNNSSDDAANSAKKEKRDVLDLIYNEDDPELCYTLAECALRLAHADGAKTLLERHVALACQAYDQLADDLNGTSPDNVTPKSLREYARSRAGKKVSQKALDFIFDEKDDKLVAFAKWKMALLLTGDKATVMERHAVAALDCINVLKRALEIVEDDNESASPADDMATDE